MRLVTFSPHPGPSTGPPDSPRPGLVVGDEIVDLSDPAVGLPSDMAELLALGPVVAEMGREPPEYQYWFNKQRTSIAGPGDPIILPTVSTMVDYEGELAMVIGRRCQHVPAARALEVVAGFTIINDVSARDWQWRTPTFTMGKSFDSHAPCGPWLVTTDELADPGQLALRTWVNDDLRQDSSTADLIFDCAAMIEYLTTAIPLEPGTIIATGTPACTNDAQNCRIVRPSCPTPEPDSGARPKARTSSVPCPPAVERGTQGTVALK